MKVSRTTYLSTAIARVQRNVSGRSTILESRDRRDCLDFRRVTSGRPLVNTAIPLFFDSPPTPPLFLSSRPPCCSRRPCSWPTTSGERSVHAALVRTVRADMNHGAVKRYRMERETPSAHVSLTRPSIQRPATVKTNSSCRKLLKWHSARSP